MFATLQNSYAEILTAKLIVLRGGSFGRCLVKGRALHEINSPTKVAMINLVALSAM
jgi:hypothetical protein